MGRFVITMPQVSIARELWRFGEQVLARRALALTADEAADIGERAGALHHSGTAARVWPNGPSGVTPAVLLAAIEFLEGEMRPASRVRRLPEKGLPAEMRLTEEERWDAMKPVADVEMARRHGDRRRDDPHR